MLIARSVHPLPGEAERKVRLMSLVDGFSPRRVLVVDRRYPPGHRHGHVTVADCLPGATGWATLDLLGGRAAPASGSCTRARW